MYLNRVAVVKKMMELNVDHRTLNQMRETMNKQIEDEKGLMKKEDFRKMFFTAFGSKNRDKTETIYFMLLPIIENTEDEDDEDYVCIGKLSMFIDFFNFYPLKLSTVKHKN